MVTISKLLLNEEKKKELKLNTAVLRGEDNRRNVFEKFLDKRLVDNKSHEHIDMNFYDPFYGGF
ncbi:MAG: hypothetical protein S4CHLAM6_13190 [Chlamydiae bacterium]|nr:hypothetical protein [Chlamydiota bacterium]